MVIKFKRGSILSGIVIIALSFLFIFFPPFTTQSTLFYLAMASYVYIAFHINEFVTFVRDKNILKYIGLLSFTTAFLIYMVLFHMVSVSDLVDPLRDILYMGFYAIPICYVISDRIIKSGRSKEDFLRILFWVANVQGVFSIMSYFSSGFHNWVLQRFIVYGYDKDKYTSLARYRLNGFAFHLTNYSPMVVALLIVFALIYAKKNVKYLLYVPLMFAFVLLNSRTAIVLVILGFVLVLFSMVKKGSDVIRIILILGLLAVVAYFSTRFISAQSDTWYGGWVQKGFTSLTSFFSDDATGYAKYIKDEKVWKMPTGYQLLTGYGSNSLYYHIYMTSDIGYLHYLWKGGIIYLLLIFAITSHILSPLMKNKEMRIYGLSAILFIVVGNIKDTIYAPDEFMMLLLLIFVTLTRLENAQKMAENSGSEQ